MKNKVLAVVSVTVGLLLASGPMFAHHSSAMYDADHPVTLAGTVTEFRFINPHVQIHFEVQDENGKVVKWMAGSESPVRLFREGWNKETLKPGDQIIMTCAPAKDGRKICNLVRIVGPNGQVLREETE
ncbi:MAG: hypothetical protein IH796_07480 [Deltaproteobacteria bacterium]|nr:hypothetical protein [Deltaproteobacteria bacterium]